MNQRRARLFYRLSLLMILMSFLSFVVLIAALFILNLQGAFNCDDPTSAGICTLRDRYQGYRILITGSTTLIVVFIILASYFQQFFLVKEPKKKKEAVKKVKEMFSKDQNLAVFEVEPQVMAPTDSVLQPAVTNKATRKVKKVKPTLIEYSIGSETQDDDLETIKQSVYNRPDHPLKLPKDLQELADDDSDYLESEPRMHPSHEPFTQAQTANINQSESETEDTKLNPQIDHNVDTIEKPHETKKEDPKEPLDDAVTPEEQSPDQTKVRILVKDESKKTKEHPTQPKKKHTSLDDNVTRKRRTQAHTKEDLSLIVAKRVNLDDTQARHIIDITFDIIKAALINHEKVNILKFGTFSTKKLKARTMQVPSKDEAETTIPAHHVIRFKSSPVFDTFLNEADAAPPIDFATINTSPKVQKSTTTVKKDMLIEAVSNQTGLSIQTTKAFMKAFITISQDTLADQDTLSLTNFGTFETIYHKEKKMVVPTTKEEKIIPGYHTVKFRPSKAFSTFLNENTFK